MPNAAIFNAYGTTEAGSVIRGEVTNDSSSEEIPLGRMVANASVHILNLELKHCGIGEPGELYISAPSLARGYLGRPDWTAECFVPNPFSEVPGQRLYRTGDIGRYRANGEIDFIGRRDRQIKIRGFRVELKQVEAALTEHEGISEAAVVVRQINNDERLTAYIVLAPGRRLTITQLHQFSRDRLPEYMVPSVFVIVESLPLTLGGKLDFMALPTPKAGRPNLDVEFESPRDPIEATIAEIWADLLGLERVGVHDGFLELGGDSLIATRIVSRCRELFASDPPLPSVLGGTVAKIAEEIRQSDQSSSI